MRSARPTDWADPKHSTKRTKRERLFPKNESANMKAVAIGILRKHGEPSDRSLIGSYLDNPDPLLGGAARAALRARRESSDSAARSDP